MERKIKVKRPRRIPKVSLIYRVKNKLMKFIGFKVFHNARVLPNQKTIFFNNFKVCSSTFDDVFRKYFRKDYAYVSKLSREEDKYFKFCFVRNPYDRLVSLYCDKELSPLAGLDKNISFKDFVMFISKTPDDELEDHYKPQYTYFPYDQKTLVDFIGRYENFEKDFNKICRRIGLKVKLKHLNKSKNKRFYPSYYTNKTKAMVMKRYYKDFKLFNYSFDLGGINKK